MIKNNMLEKFKNGEKALGSFASLGSSAAIECLGIVGLDFVIIDTEHGPGNPESAVPLILAAERWNMTPLVRVQDATRSSVLKMLDIGAMGLVIPFIKSVEEVEKIVEYGKYAPLGQRGFGGGRKSGFGLLPESKGLDDYFNTCNRKTLIIPQCETVEALENIEKLASMEGVDGIFVGPIDLSIALGKPMQFSDPEFIAAVSRTVKVFKEAGKFCLTIALSGAAAKSSLANGFDGVAAASEVGLLSQAAKVFMQDAK